MRWLWTIIAAEWRILFSQEIRPIAGACKCIDVVVVVIVTTNINIAITVVIVIY